MSGVSTVFRVPDSGLGMRLFFDWLMKRGFLGNGGMDLPLPDGELCY